MVTRCPSVLQLLPEYFRTPVNKPHTLTEKERDSYGFGERGDHGEDTKALSLATRSFTWKVSFGNPCSMRGSPQNLVENEGFLLIVVRISRITTEASDGDEPRGTWQLTLASTV